jgi:hypothetical protein
MVTKTEYRRRDRQWEALERLGVSWSDAETLRLISVRLHSWDERLCNDTEEDEDGTAYRLTNLGGPGPIMRWKCPNRGRGALARLAKIAARYPNLTFFHQSDPRGAALYVGPEGMTDCNYSSMGVAVY